MRTLKEFLWTLVHFGPIATLLLVKTITLSTIYCSLMWWPPNESSGGLICLTTFLIASGMVLYNFFGAISNGPGYLPLKWKPAEESALPKLQYCQVCQGYKAPRAHHCRKCGRCVMKLDHHCPWINSCVGHGNHTNFILFLISAVWGCSHGVIILACSIYRAINRNHYYYDTDDESPIVYLGLYGFLWCLFSLGCAFGVVLGVGILLYYQVKVVLRNQTTIEEWIMEKAEFRRKRFVDEPRFVYPYDLGWRKNILLVFNRSFTPVGNGIDWPVVSGCDQYTLTIEQIEQKEEKRKRMKEYVIIEDYAGSWCPVSHGCGVYWHPPFSDESRIPVAKNDRVLVTRWKKYWLYGEKAEDEQISGNGMGDAQLVSGKEKAKGWFPRRCSMEVINAFPNDSDSDSNARTGETSRIASKKTN